MELHENHCRLREFVDQVHIPFVTTQMGKGVVTGISRTTLDRPFGRTWSIDYENFYFSVLCFSTLNVGGSLSTP